MLTVLFSEIIEAMHMALISIDAGIDNGLKKSLKFKESKLLSLKFIKNNLLSSFLICMDIVESI